MDIQQACDTCFNLSANQLRKHASEREWRLGNDEGIVITSGKLYSTADVCLGCKTLLRGIIEVDRPFPKELCYSIIFNLKGLPLRICGINEVEFFMTEEGLNDTSCIGRASLVDATPTLESVAKMALGWASRCTENHKACTKVNSASFLPKRVIDVGRNDDSVPRLYEPAESITARYVALSYCWGPEGHNLTTTHESLPSHCRGIPLASLPRTFLQAVQLCRLLGVRYIWIDSLCIIQQDQTDWEYHVGHMASIYGNAWIVLSASASSTVHQGLLVDRAKALEGFQVHKLTVTANDTNTAEKREADIFARRRLSHSTIIPEYFHPSSNCPLLTRGWTFQERLLAKRTLHFLPQELLWECESNYWCECMSCERHMDEDPADLGVSRSSDFNRVMLTNPSHEALDKLWRTIISSYSHRQFTRYEDRLPALMGIAIIIEKKSSIMRGYHAGHWAGNLAMNLTWQVDGHGPIDDNIGAEQNHQNTSTQTTRGRSIPSWSWASTPFPVRWVMYKLYPARMEVDILATDWGNKPVYSTRSPDTTVKGTIELMGALTVAKIDIEHPVYWKGEHGLKHRVILAREDPPNIVDGRIAAIFYPDVLPDYLKPQKNLKPYNLEKSKLLCQNQVVSIVLTTSCGRVGETDWHGLALVESTRVVGAYERVGMIEGGDLPSWFDGIEKSKINIV